MMITKNQASYLTTLIRDFNAAACYEFHEACGQNRVTEKVKADADNAKTRLERYITKLMEPKN